MVKPLYPFNTDELLKIFASDIRTVSIQTEMREQLFFDLGVCENDSIKRFFDDDFASNKEAKRERSQLPTKGRECQMSRERVRKIIEYVTVLQLKRRP